MKLGNGRGCPLVVHYWADLQSVHGFHCYDNIAPNAKCQWVLVLAVCLVFGWPFVKRFTLCYRSTVCDIGVLWPNGWMNQHETWHGGRPRPMPQGVMGTQLPPERGTAEATSQMASQSVQLFLQRSRLLQTSWHMYILCCSIWNNRLRLHISEMWTNNKLCNIVSTLNRSY